MQFPLGGLIRETTISKRNDTAAGDKWGRRQTRVSTLSSRKVKNGSESA
jgi:hypothetical protein